MSKFVFKRIHSVASLAASTYFLRIRSFSATPIYLKSIDSCSEQSSFTVHYLINSCGLTPEKALSVSKYVNFEKADKPNSVLNLFKDHGFTETQISTLIGYAPRLLVNNPQKTLFPKIEFLKSKGFLASDVATILSRSQVILKCSLKNYLIPFFNIYGNFLLSDKKIIVAFKRFIRTPRLGNAKYIQENIEMLKKAGVPSKNIGFLFAYQPRIFLSKNDRFGNIIEEVIKLGFSPSNVTFMIAIKAFNLMSKATWDKKVEVYKKWGWSEDDIIGAFRKHPWCMIVSEVKINSVMEYWVNKMEWKSLDLAKRPKIISYSLEKRVVPRCEVYRLLVSNDLLNPSDSIVSSMLNYSESCFWEKFIDPHKEEAPEILKLYEQKMDLAYEKEMEN